ncbi:hypothetical protein XELAEV_18033022mg [Xenopus laevis]|uniref:Uncharacterized protein n=1 Tax=Xenopus laevis TaxID=8355 RepID=A0A974HDK4_XENLA|nr:hypothetical protein XELAEV_18033022mg [Xenopus laevis]
MTLAPSMFKAGSSSETWLHSRGMYRCGSTWCVTCKVVVISDTFECSVTRETDQIKSYINCNTKAVVYLITSGENTPVSRHFQECNSGNVELVSVQDTERVTLDQRGGDLQTKLLRREVQIVYEAAPRSKLSV